MQPEDQKEAFQPPQATEYFSQAPVEGVEPITDASDAPLEDQNTENMSDDAAISWEAPEYLHQEKGFVWFSGLAIVVAALILLDILVIKSFLFSFSALVVVMAAALIVYARRPADLIHYVISQQGIFINDTLHAFAEFKGFGVIHDGKEFSVELIPVRRFRPSLAMYFPEDRGETIVDLLGVRLPMHNIKPDFFDKIIHSLGL